jgi:hypothetical protein
VFSVRSDPRLYKGKISEKDTEKTVQKRRNYHSLKGYYATTNECITDWNIESVF